MNCVYFDGVGGYVVGVGKFVVIDLKVLVFGNVGFGVGVVVVVVGTSVVVDLIKPLAYLSTSIEIDETSGGCKLVSMSCIGTGDCL